MLDAETLATGRTVLGAAWVPPDGNRDADQVRLTAGALLDPAAPVATVRRDGWVLESAPGRLAGAASKAARRLRAPGCHVLALRHDRDLTGLVVTESELDPLAMALVGMARLAGPVIVAGRRGGVGEHVHADRVVPGGRRLARSVRVLQAEGRGVAVVSGRQHEALAAPTSGSACQPEGGRRGLLTYSPALAWLTRAG